MPRSRVPPGRQQGRVGDHVRIGRPLPDRLVGGHQELVGRVLRGRTRARVVVRAARVEAHRFETLLGAVRLPAAADEPDARESELASPSPHCIERAVDLLDRAEGLRQLLDGEEHDHRLAVVPTVVSQPPISLGPVVRHRQQLLGGVAGERIVVGPHHAELDQVAVAGPQEPVVEPSADVLLAVTPIPVVDEESDAVLDGPLDVPVGHLRIALAIEPQQRATLGKLELMAPPLRLLRRPAREVVDADVVRRLDRPGDRHVAGLGLGDGRGDGDSSGHGAAAQLDTDLVFAGRRSRQSAGDLGGLARLDERTGRFRGNDLHTRRTGEADAHRLLRLGPDVLKPQRHRRGSSCANDRVCGSEVPAAQPGGARRLSGQRQLADTDLLAGLRREPDPDVRDVALPAFSLGHVERESLGFGPVLQHQRRSRQTQTSIGRPTQSGDRQAGALQLDLRVPQLLSRDRLDRRQRNRLGRRRRDRQPAAFDGHRTDVGQSEPRVGPVGGEIPHRPLRDRRNALDDPNAL